MAHQCHAYRCGKPCPPRHLMCAPCWATVSPATQREVYRTVKLRGKGVDATWAPWWRAQSQAIKEAADAAGYDVSLLMERDRRMVARLEEMGA